MTMRSRSYQRANHQKANQSSTGSATPRFPRSRGFAPQPTPQIEYPDIQTQLERANRLGHRIENIFPSNQQNDSPPHLLLPPVLPLIQPKLAIGALGETYEQETAPSVQRAELSEEEEIQMSPLADQIQRVYRPEDEELQMKPSLPRSPAVALPASAELEGAIAQARGNGQPLTDTIRQPMKQVVGDDFGGMSMHTEAQKNPAIGSCPASTTPDIQRVLIVEGKEVSPDITEEPIEIGTENAKKRHKVGKSPHGEARKRQLMDMKATITFSHSEDLERLLEMWDEYDIGSYVPKRVISDVDGSHLLTWLETQWGFGKNHRKRVIDEYFKPKDTLGSSEASDDPMVDSDNADDKTAAIALWIKPLILPTEPFILSDDPIILPGDSVSSPDNLVTLPDGFDGLPNDILANIVIHLDYKTLQEMMGLSKTIFTKVAEWVSHKIFGQVIGGNGDLLQWGKVYQGVLRIMAKGPTNSPRLAEEPAMRQPGVAVPGDLAEAVIKAVGWRHYSCKMRTHHNSVDISFQVFAEEVRRHTEETSRLKRIHGRGDSYPVRKYFDIVNGVKLQQNSPILPILQNLANEWYARQSPVARVKYNDVTDPYDKAAGLISAYYGQGGQGQHFTVVRAASDREVERGASDMDLLVYSNHAFDPSQRSNQFKPSEGCGCTESTVTVWGTKYNYQIVQGQDTWGRGEGKARTSTWKGEPPYDIPFHSDVQRVEEQERCPWDLTYAGGVYNACIQCLSVLHALGHPAADSFRGSHGAKAQSIIPSRVRQNSVYLEQYLGESVYKAMMALSDQAVIEMLDYIERGEKAFYQKHGVASGPTGYF